MIYSRHTPLFLCLKVEFICDTGVCPPWGQTRWSNKASMSLELFVTAVVTTMNLQPGNRKQPLKPFQRDCWSFETEMGAVQKTGWFFIFQKSTRGNNHWQQF